MFSPGAGHSLQIQEPRLQFCPKAGLPLQTQEPRFHLCPKADLQLQTQEPRLQFNPKAGLPLQTQEPRLQFNPKAGFPLQTQEPRLQFCWRQIFHCKFRSQGYSSAQRQVFHCKLRNQGFSFPGMNICGSFPLLFAPHSLFRVWTNLKRSEKIPGTPTRRWGEWIWLTGLSGLHRKSPQWLNVSSIRVFDQIRDPEIYFLVIRMVIFIQE